MIRRDPKLPKMAEKAFKKAVARVIEDHRRTGDPIAVWRDGKVVLLPVEQFPSQESGVIN